MNGRMFKTISGEKKKKKGLCTAAKNEAISVECIKRQSVNESQGAKAVAFGDKKL